LFGCFRGERLEETRVSLSDACVRDAYSVLSDVVTGEHVDYEAASRACNEILARLPDVNERAAFTMPDVDGDVAMLLRLQLGIAIRTDSTCKISPTPALDQEAAASTSGLLDRMCSIASRSGKGLVRDLHPGVDSDWEFDVARLNVDTNGRALSLLATHFIKSCGAVAKLAIHERKVAACMRAIEVGYRGNPYHNSVHAACVLQQTHLLVNCMGVDDPYVRLVAYVAAVVHDYDHVGLTNAYLVHTGHAIAVTHNDNSPMENHSLQAAFRVMASDGNDFLADLPPKRRRDARRDIISLVMATDMTRHMDFHSRFCAAHATSSADRPRRDSMEPRMRDIQFALKCADLGHTFLPFDLHVRWVLLLEEECFMQGDLERARGMPVTPLFDRAHPGLTRSQVGFFEIVVFPMLSVFSRAFPRSDRMLASATSNAAHWYEQGRADGESSKRLPCLSDPAP
jgi:hypothetical protein